MLYRKVTIHIKEEAEDIVSALLYEIGIQGIEIKDKIPLSSEDSKAMFIDILPEAPEDDGKAEVIFYVEIAKDSVTNGTLMPGGIRSKNEIVKPYGQRSYTTDPSIDASYKPVSDNICSEEEFPVLLDKIHKKLSDYSVFLYSGETDYNSGSSIMEGIEWSEMESEDWENNWKQYFHPFEVAGILIHPSWEKNTGRDLAAGEDSSKKIISLSLDPGSSFGTGQHETTRLCLSALRRYLKPGMVVADIGTGSGILGIAALLLGAYSVTGTDLDLDCRAAVRKNLALNSLPDERFSILIANAVGSQEEQIKVRERMGKNRFDIVLANILSQVIVLLIKDISFLLKEGGIFIASGILNEKKFDILEALKSRPELKTLEINSEGEWISFVIMKGPSNARHFDRCAE